MAIKLYCDVTGGRLSLHDPPAKQQDTQDTPHAAATGRQRRRGRMSYVQSSKSGVFESAAVACGSS